MQEILGFNERPKEAKIAENSFLSFLSFEFFIRSRTYENIIKNVRSVFVT